MKISSQRERHEDIIEEKIKNNDFEVMVSPEFTYEGEVYQVVIDGHHSFEAAIRTGNNPEFIEATDENDDRIATSQDDPELYLTLNDMGDDWYDIETGDNVWA